jgi:hypothetical protein
LAASPIWPLPDDGSLGAAHNPDGIKDGEEVGLAETVEDTATDSTEVGVVDTVEDMVVESIEDGEFADDATEMALTEVTDDDTASEELGETGCDGGKHVSSYNCAVDAEMNLVTWDSGMLNRKHRPA